MRIRYYGKFGKGQTLRALEKEVKEEKKKEKLGKKDKIAYFLIVLLGVLAFIISTILLAKPEQAEAAIGGVAPELYEIDFGEYEDKCKGIIGRYEYFTIYKGCFEKGKEHFYYCFSTSSDIKDASSNRLYHSEYFIVECGIDTVVYVSPYAGEWATILDETNKFIGSTYSIYGLEQSGKLEYPSFSSPPVYVYNYDSTYLKFVNRSFYNAFFVDRDMDFNNSNFLFTFDLGNVSEEPVVKREVEFGAYIYLPSRELIDEIWRRYKEKDWEGFGNGEISTYVNIADGSYCPEWLRLLENKDNIVGKKFYVKFTGEIESNKFDVKLTHEWIASAFEEYVGKTIEEYYDMDGITVKDSVMMNIVMSYMWVSRLDGIVYSTYDDRIEYGRLVSVNISSSLNDPVIYESTFDPLFIGPGIDIDSDINASINQAYKDALQEVIKDNQEMEDILNGSGGSFGDLSGSGDAFDDLSGSNLWESFKNLSDGLSSLGPALLGIGSLIGSVFSFLPAPVTGIIMFTFVAICIIAIIKAIRG